MFFGRSDHCHQWFYDGFLMLLPSLSMVFDGSGPLVKRCDGFNGSLWSIPFSLRQGKMFSARTSNFATLTQPFQRFQRFLWSVNCTTWPLTLVTLSMASSIDQSKCLPPNIMVSMKLFNPDHMRGFQNIIDIGQIYGIVTKIINIRQFCYANIW